ncbi:cingulin-like [Protopterus annectens]|uniref:cingulin-like n=1 Tax=Protopterus annectens TaxID=7888 RepID=UPI001CFB1765|nr:cingulin-like [Protopterus annectens]
MMPGPTPNQDNILMTKSEVVKLLQKYKKERDDAFRKGETSRDKLRLIEIATKSYTTELRQKIKELSDENTKLVKTIKKLRTDLGLESDPRFRGKIPKDLIKELQEKEEECRSLIEENNQLNLRITELTVECEQVQKWKRVLESRLQAVQSEMQDLIREKGLALHLWEETKAQRDELEQANKSLWQSVMKKEEKRKDLASKSVQTVTSIPIYRRICSNKLRELEISLQLHKKETEKVRTQFENLTTGNIKGAYSSYPQKSSGKTKIYYSSFPK